MHDVSGAEIVCRYKGIVESITHSILDVTAQDPEWANFIVSEAIESKSLRFLSRLDTGEPIVWLAPPSFGLKPELVAKSCGTRYVFSSELALPFPGLRGSP